MVGKRYESKRFLKQSLQTQVVDFKEKFRKTNVEIVEQSPDDGLVIPEATEDKQEQKKTANDIHKEIKELVEQEKLEEATSVLQQALQLGYKGKRLDKWREILMPDDTALLE